MDASWLKSSIKYNKKYNQENSFASNMYKRELDYRDAVEDKASSSSIYAIYNSLAI
jgi:hypothetical protein